MHRVAVQTVLILLMFIVKVEGNVSFWRDEVTLTCPKEGSWEDAKGSLNIPNSNMHKFKFERQVQIKCKYDDEGGQKKEYAFYVKGKACENCFELDAFIVGTAIAVDVIGTVFVMMVVYRFTKKKSSDGPTPSSKTPGRSGHQAPSVPNRDYGYEALSPQTRAQDTYSTVNRMG